MATVLICVPSSTRVFLQHYFQAHPQIQSASWSVTSEGVRSGLWRGLWAAVCEPRVKSETCAFWLYSCKQGAGPKIIWTRGGGCERKRKGLVSNPSSSHSPPLPVNLRFDFILVSLVPLLELIMFQSLTHADIAAFRDPNTRSTLVGSRTVITVARRRIGKQGVLFSAAANRRHRSYNFCRSTTPDSNYQYCWWGRDPAYSSVRIAADDVFNRINSYSVNALNLSCMLIDSRVTHNKRASSLL